MKTKLIITNKGFTLLEMIISLAIFTIVALVAVGALLKIMDANRKAITLKTAINNINFALESMSREMRMGNTYYCDNSMNSRIQANHSNKDCSYASGNWVVVFNTAPCLIGSSDSTYMKGYKLESGRLKKAESANCGNSLETDDDYVDILSPDIVINESSVIIRDSGSEPYAEFLLAGYVGLKEKDKTYFKIRTGVSQRIR